MRRRIEEIPEPGMGADGGGDTERTVLGELEDLEVVEDDRLGERRGKRGKGAGVQEKSMATEAGAQAGDGGGGADEGACNLAMGGAGLEQGGDGAEELGALQVIEKREAVLGKGTAAALTEEARDASASRLRPPPFAEGEGWGTQQRRAACRDASPLPNSSYIRRRYTTTVVGDVKPSPRRTAPSLQHCTSAVLRRLRHTLGDGCWVARGRRGRRFRGLVLGAVSMGEGVELLSDGIRPSRGTPTAHPCAGDCHVGLIERAARAAGTQGMARLTNTC